MLFFTLKSTKSHTILFILLDLPLLNYKNDHNILIDNNNIKINENKLIISKRFLYRQVKKQLMMTKIARPTFDKVFLTEFFLLRKIWL